MSWNLARLGEICDFMTGGTPSTKDPLNYQGGMIPWIASGDIHQTRLRQASKHISQLGLDTSPAKFLPRGSVLIALNGQGRTRGTVAMLDIDQATCNQSVISMNPKDSDKLLSEYLFVTLRSMYSELRNLTGDKKRSGLNMRVLREFRIPLPPLAEQKRIATILDAADALRAKRRESLAQLDTLIQATFLEMFGDPVANPKGWPVYQFGSLGTSRLGKMLDAAKQTETDRFPYLANLNVQWNRFVLDDLREMTFTKADRAEFALQPGDLLICEGGEVGRAAIWQGDRKHVYFQKALHRVRLDPITAVPEFVLWYMWFMAKHGGFSDFTTSATIAHLTGVKLKKLPVPLPPIELQQQFATISHSIDKYKEILTEHCDSLDELFASLQSRAFAGEL